MGIQGLLIGLKPYTIHGNILDYANGTVAVDTSSWLHKSIYSIADHYVECQERKVIDQRCIDVAARYMTQRCRELHDGFRVGGILLVLDGKRSPLKAGTNQDRDDRRAEHLRLARQYAQQKRPDAAFEKYKSCIKIVDALTIPVVQLVAQRLNYVQLVWSPYEADSQLAQLCMDGRAVVCITEDSDVLVYSAAAQKSFPIIYKLDRQSGNCDIISMDWLFNPILPARQQSKDINVSQLEVIFDKLRLRQQQSPGWGARLFVMGCVLAGCDYAPRQILGVGLVKAFKLVKDAGITGSDKNLSKIFRYILQTALSTKSRGSIKDGNALEEQLAQSEAVFYYHPVQQHDGRIMHFTSHETVGSPNLDRFVDCSFLGSLVVNEHDDGHNGIIPAKAQLVAATTTKSPRTKKQAAAAAKATKNPINHYFIAKEDKKKKVAATPPPQRRASVAAKRPPGSATTSSLSSPRVVNNDDDYKYAQENIQNFVTVAKKKKPTTTNNPAAINPYTKQGQAELRHNQALASYRSRHDEPETMQRIHRLVTLQIPWIRHHHHQRDDTVDVRGVKRKFPKDGTRTIHPQQKNVVAATTSGTTAAVRHQPPPPPPVIDERFERAFARPSLSSNNHTVSSPSLLLSSSHDHHHPSASRKRSRFFYDEQRPTEEEEPPVADEALQYRRRGGEVDDEDFQQQPDQQVQPTDSTTDRLVNPERIDHGRLPQRDENVQPGHHQPLDVDLQRNNEHYSMMPAGTDLYGPNRVLDRFPDHNNEKVRKSHRHQQPRDKEHQQNVSDPPTPPGATDICESDLIQVIATTDHHVGQAARFVGGPDRNEKVRPSHHRPPLEYEIQQQQNEHYPTIPPAATKEGLFQSPFFGNNATVGETAFQGYTEDEPVQPNPAMDSANLFAVPPSSPNLLLDPTQEEDEYDDEEHEEEHYGGPICSSRWPEAPEARRVTMAHVKPKEKPVGEPSFDFYRQDCSPAAQRPTGDREVVDLLGDESEEDDLDVLNVNPMVPMPAPEPEVDYGIREPEPPPPRERSTIGPAKTHRNRYQTSDSHAQQGRRPLSYVQSFLAKNRKRRSKQDSHSNKTADPSCASTGKTQKQTLILSHFKLGERGI
jgi:5'-3' exonuclease